MSEKIEVQFETNAIAFEQRVLPLLVAKEVENCLLIGLISRRVWEEREGKLNGEAVMITVLRGGNVVGAASMMGQRAMVITEMGSEEISAIIGSLLAHGIVPSGVRGLADVSEQFAREWGTRAGCDAGTGKGLLLYKLDRVKARAFPRGFLRPGKPGDLEMLTEYLEAFANAVGHSYWNSPRPEVERAIRDAELFVWFDAEAGGVVSMAGIAGPTPNGIRINRVYTPPELRGRGYASAVVAALSQRMLDGGKKFCFLFTEAGNPTSNYIYQEIGYEQVCVCQEWDFSEPTSAVKVRLVAVEEVIPLRHEVLRAGLPVESAQFAGDEAVERHAGVFDSEGKCVACGTLSLEEYEGERAYRLRGMAVAEGCRKLGLGKEVLGFLEEEAQREGVSLLWCNARTPAVGFYLKRGWRVVGEEFEVPTAGPHFRMIKDIG